MWYNYFMEEVDLSWAYKKQGIRGWRDGSVCLLFRRPEFGSQNPQKATQNCLELWLQGI